MFYPSGQFRLSNKNMSTLKKAVKLELVGPDTGLTPEQLLQANELHQKFPAIVIAHKKVKEQEKNLLGKWFALCEQLREPGTGVTLNAREMTLILRGLGEPKSRVSEIIRVVSVDDKVWADYKAQVIGFRAVLAIARGKVDAGAGEGEGESDGEGGGEGEGKAEKDKPVVKTIPPTYANIIANALADDPKQFEPTGRGYYELVYTCDYAGNRRKFTVTIEVEDVAKK